MHWTRILILTRAHFVFSLMVAVDGKFLTASENLLQVHSLSCLHASSSSGGRSFRGSLLSPRPLQHSNFTLLKHGSFRSMLFALPCDWEAPWAKEKWEKGHLEGSFTFTVPTSLVLRDVILHRFGFSFLSPCNSTFPRLCDVLLVFLSWFLVTSIFIYSLCTDSLLIEEEVGIPPLWILS